MQDGHVGPGHRPVVVLDLNLTASFEVVATMYEITVAVPRTKHAVRRRLAFPVDDVSRRQIRPPPRTSPRPFCYMSGTTAPLRKHFVITARHSSLDCAGAYYSAALLTLACDLNR